MYIEAEQHAKLDDTRAGMTCHVDYAPDRIVAFLHDNTRFFLSQQKCLVFRSEVDASKSGAYPCGYAQQVSARGGYLVHLDNADCDT